MYAMECIVGKEFGSSGTIVKFSSAFHGDVINFMCLNNYNDTVPFPGMGFDKEEVVALRNWLDGILNNYDKSSNLCQNCFKALPEIAGLNNKGYWIVSCKFCNHQHEIGKNE